MQQIKEVAAHLAIMIPTVASVFALPPFEGFLKSLQIWFKLMVVMLWLMAISVIWRGI